MSDVIDELQPFTYADWTRAKRMLTSLPEHESAVCPQCDWAGVLMRCDTCECSKCGYEWRWPYPPMGLD